MCEEYNGWTNRETWAVALYINNDQGWQEQVHDVVRGVIENQLVNHHTTEVPAYKVGEAIREQVETLLDPSQYRDEFGEQQPEALASALYDIGSLYRVDWDEIGAAFLSDIAEG